MGKICTNVRKMEILGRYLRFQALLCLVFGIIWFCVHSSMAQEEKTYTISLQKTAQIAQEIHKLGEKKVLAEPHRVVEGEHIWQILREKGLLVRRDLPALLSALKELNSSLQNLDLIHPGQKILIPLKIVPVKGLYTQKAQPAQVKASVAELKGVKLENYTVQPGDSVIKVVTGKYNIPPARLYDEYLNLVRKLNPEIKDLNKIYPGQKIRLPIYSPQVVRKPVEKPLSKKASLTEEKEAPSPYVPALRTIFRNIGEEWVDTGQHFIPLRSGGQIDLKASSFPVIAFLSGRRVILDIYDRLPEKITKLIEASWGNYKVVHISGQKDLRTLLDEIFSLAGYLRVASQGEPIEVEDKIPLSISGDWVLVRSEKPLENGFRMVVLNLTEQEKQEGIPLPLKRFLEGLGIKVVDYPEVRPAPMAEPGAVEEIRAGKDAKDLVKTLLRITGHRFREDVEIPVVGNEKSDFNLVIKADFFLKTKGQDSIIDLTGLEPTVISFLTEHEFRVLKLAGTTDPSQVVADTLTFLGIPFDKGVHALTAMGGQGPQITLKIQGIVFADAEKRAVFATSLTLPRELEEFLTQKGFRILLLTAS